MLESQRRNGSMKKDWKKQVEEESMNVGLCKGDALCDQRALLALVRLPLG